MRGPSLLIPISGNTLGFGTSRLKENLGLDASTIPVIDLRYLENWDAEGRQPPSRRAMWWLRRALRRLQGKRPTGAWVYIYSKRRNDHRNAAVLTHEAIFIHHSRDRAYPDCLPAQGPFRRDVSTHRRHPTSTGWLADRSRSRNRAGRSAAREAGCARQTIGCSRASGPI